LREWQLLARGKILYLATIIDRKRHLAHQSQNEDNFATFPLGLRVLKSGRKSEKQRKTRLSISAVTTRFKAMLHRAIFLATCKATFVALPVAGKNSRVTPHFATAIVALQVARKVEGSSTFHKVVR